MCEPITPFVYIRITESSLHTNGQSSCFCCVYAFCCNVWTANETASLTLRCHIRCRTAHIEIYTPKAFVRPTNTHLPKLFRLIPPYMSHNWLFIFCKCSTPTYTKFPFRVTITLCICKFCKKHIRSGRFTHDMAKNNVCHIFHWCKYKKWAW